MRTLNQLVGTTAANSQTLYPTSFTSYIQNNSAQSVALGTQLVSDAHRILLQKYFDNESTSTTTTVGGMNLTLTGAPSLGAVSATLTASWTYPTGSQLVTFSNGQQINVLFTNGSTTITWTTSLTSSATTAIKTLGFQYYRIPANISKIKDDTITVGQLKFTPREIKTRVEWDLVNTLPYTSDIPNYYFIYGGYLGIFPIPSTTGNTLTFNYKNRVADFSYTDYSIGTLATMAQGGTTVTGTSTLWTAFPQNVDLSFFNLMLRADPATGGDGIWYSINSFQSATSLTLNNPVINAPNITSSTTYTIGQIPVLSEDFHDMLVFRSLMIYYSSIVSDKEKHDQFEAMYNMSLELLKDYAGTKSVNVDLGPETMLVNPNLFYTGN